MLARSNTGVCEIKAAGPYKLIGFGVIDVTRPFEFIWFGDVDAPKLYEFKGSGGCPKGRAILGCDTLAVSDPKTAKVDGALGTCFLVRECVGRVQIGRELNLLISSPPRVGGTT